MKTQTLPETIGGIPVIPVEGKNTFLLPRLDDEGLTLPLSSFQGLTLLKNGKQCVIHVKMPTRDPMFFFAGHDEDPKSRPFITRIHKEAAIALRDGGESAFFDALTPPLIKKCIQFFPESVYRQGDLWVAKIGNSWETVAPLIHMLFTPTSVEPASVVGHPLFSTRHTCTGTLWTFQLHRTTERTIILRRNKSKAQPRKVGTEATEVDTTQVILMQGILEAPDHTTVDASDGIYVVERTVNLLPTPGTMGYVD